MHSGIDFRRSVPEKPVLVKADGEKTFRILSNLIVNITKYAMTGSRAYLSVEQQDGYAVVTMKNTSAQELNIPPEYLTERFVRGDESRNSEGSGLGLAIARSFTELQSGIFSIEIDGDLFKAIVKLPLA
jgi:signal transduction histidine kinase